MVINSSVKVSYLEEWIDGTTIQTSSDNFGAEEAVAGFAWNLYNSVLKLFTTVVPLMPKTTFSSSRTMKECLGKLFLWGDGFRDWRLDCVLEESDDLREIVIASLIAIGGTLTSSSYPRSHRQLLLLTQFRIRPSLC